MKRRRPAITLIALLTLLLTTNWATGQGPDPEGEAQPQGDVSIASSVNPRISYQGRLLEDDAPVTGSRDMTFRLYSDDICATQVGSDIAKNGVTVTDGLFSVELDVTHSDFNGQGLWLEAEVGGTVIGCQEILPVPYALSLRPEARINDSDSVISLNRLRYALTIPQRKHKYGIEAEVDGSFDYAYGVYGSASNQGGVAAYGLYGSASASGGTAYGVYGQSETDSVDARGVYGTAPYTGVEGHATATDGGATSGVYGQSDSSSDDASGVRGYASASSGNTKGVHGEAVSPSGRGVYGRAPNIGLMGEATATSGQTVGVFGRSYCPSGAGVYGTAPKYGLHGVATASSGISYGVYGDSETVDGKGVVGHASGSSGTGVYGWADGEGVLGESYSSSGIGVRGENTSTDHDSDGAGVEGSSWYGTGVRGTCLNGIGVSGSSGVDDGVYGETWGEGAGVHGVANVSTGKTYGVRGESPSENSRGYGGYFLGYNGVYGEATNGSDYWKGYGGYFVGYNGVYGEATNGLGHAAVFSGTAQTHVLEITGGSDLSERFDVTAAGGDVTPGVVVCIDTDQPGRLLVCDEAYARTVAGVVSGAGGIEPGMVMGQEGSPADGAHPVALTGRVYVWADASAGPIQPGDLLTPSDTAGHVMKVSDYEQAQGAIIGKAMGTLDEDQGLILVLVTLQ